jgi:hypothetical protein
MTGRDHLLREVLVARISLLLSFQAPLAGHCATGRHVVHGIAAVKVW